MGDEHDKQEALMESALQLLDDLLMARAPDSELPEELKSHPEFIKVYEKLSALRDFSLQLSHGDLSQTIKQKGFVAGAIRNLQANLRHLTWQTQAVAAGDLSQRIDFMGDFSCAFNSMTEALAKAKAALQSSEARYRLLAENALDIIWTIDREGTFTYISPSVARFPSFLQGGIGKNVNEVLSSEQMKLLRESLFKAMQDEHLARQGMVFETEFAGSGPQDTIYLETTVSALEDDDGKMVGLLGVAHDISEHKHMQKKLLQMATIDALTGIANRRFFIQIGEEEASRAVRYNHTYSVMIMDIDHFKRVNDTYGHPAGDEVLRNLAAIGSGALRSADIIGRLGGEEFGVILPETAADAAFLVAERLRRAFETAVVKLEDGQEVTFTVSIGVTTKAALNESFDEMLKKADRALYVAKDSGRNRVCAAK